MNNTRPGEHLIICSSYVTRLQLSLDSLGLQSGSKIMFETKRADDQWPADRLIESEKFRDFRVGMEVDAQDHTGQWNRGQVSASMLLCKSRIVQGSRKGNF